MNLPLPDMQQVYREIESCGFVSPPRFFYKKDMRGAEYGDFEVAVRDTDNIRVSNRDADGKWVYSMFFQDANNFKAWAANNT